MNLWIGARRCHAIRVFSAMGMAVCLLIGSTGCEPLDGEKATSDASSSAKTDISGAGQDDPPIVLTPVDQEKIQKLVAENEGKVVLLDFWATWCGPCIEKLPHVAELQERHADEGLVVYTVCIGNHTDEEAVASAQKVLQRVGGGFGALVSNHQKDEAAFNDLGITVVPYYRLYGRDGKVIDEFEGMPDDFDDIVAKALKQ